MSERMKEVISKIKREGKYRIISIRSNKAIKGIEEIKNAGPVDFISLVKNASCILSNSFHATAFSLIYHKLFYTFSYGNKKSSERILELLRVVGLTERYDCKHFLLDDSINYDKVQMILNAKQKESREWLVNALKSK